MGGVHRKQRGKKEKEVGTVGTWEHIHTYYLLPRVSYTKKRSHLGQIVPTCSHHTEHPIIDCKICWFRHKETAGRRPRIKGCKTITVEDGQK